MLQKEKYKTVATEKVEIKSSIENIAEWAKKHGTSLRELKAYNPWLKTNRLDVKDGKTYEIKILIRK